MAMMGPGSGPPTMHWWLGRRKSADTGPANSGLTGDPEIEQPPEDQGPKDLRGRWLNFKQSVTGTSTALPRVLRLVWDASPAITLALFATTAIAGVIPAASAYAAKLLINAVVEGIAIHSFHQPDRETFSLGPWHTPVFTAVNGMIFLVIIQLALFAVQTLLTFISMIALLVVVSPLLAVIALVSPIPAFIADTRYGWRGYNIARWGSRLLRRMNYLVTLVTTDSYAKEVKLFGLGPYFINRYRMIAKNYYSSQRSQVARRYMTGFALGNLSTIVTSLTYLYVALQAIIGRLTLGDLTLYTTAASQVQGSIQGILGGFSGMYEHNLYLNNLFELMETKSALPVPAKATKVPQPLRGEIHFENVTFAYPGAEANALSNLTFTVRPGETLAIVGRNGAGKTTLFKLICRLYDPNEGRILIDGIDIRDFDPNELRAQIGAMFQDYVTYQATAAENIGLGNVPDINDRERIEVAGAQAGASELIGGLPDGYDTALGKWFDHGVNLSGGEWQKVALARAFMRDAKILLLDEPTSALDAQAEYDLFERLRSLTRGRTAVYISHRFSTVRRADRIVFLEHGRLVEEGTHAELMKLNGRYARLFRMQASAYTGEDVVPEPEDVKV